MRTRPRTIKDELRYGLDNLCGAALRGCWETAQLFGKQSQAEFLALCAKLRPDVPSDSIRALCRMEDAQ